MISENQDHRRRISEIVSSSYYKEWVAIIFPLLRTTRSGTLMRDPIGFLKIQGWFVELLRGFDEANKQGKKAIYAARAGGDMKETKSLELQLAINRHITRMIHMIADGLAFRMLQFDRPFLRLMVTPDKKQASVDFATVYPGMLKVAQRLTQANGSYVLFNDLTNVLRHGDLTEFLPNGKVLIHELKKNGDRIINILTVIKQMDSNPSGKRSQQVENLLTAQFARDLRQIDTPKGIIKIWDIDLPFHNYLDELARLIRMARLSGKSGKKLGTHLYVSCLSLDSVEKLTNNDVNLNRPSWNSTDSVISVGNLDLCFLETNEYARNMTPYSIFPLSLHDCMDLMSGRLIINAWVNLSEVMRLFEDRDWQVEETPEAEDNTVLQSVTETRAAGDVSEILGTDGIPVFTVKRGAFNLRLPLPLLMRLGTELMCPSMLLAIAEYTFAKATFGVSERTDTFFKGEQKVWA